MDSPGDMSGAAELPATGSSGLGALCPVDRLPRRSRNKICIAIITLGGFNFLLYTLVYAVLGGDARNGRIEVLDSATGGKEIVYYVGGHYIRSLEGRHRALSRWLWIYSYVHSVTVPITSGAMIISMLVLARPHILATMRDGFVSGQTFVTVFGTLVVLVTSFVVVLFTWELIAELAAANAKLAGG